MDALWKQGLDALNCNISAQQIEQLKHYVNLLQRWNKTYNLTAIRDPRQIIPVHIFDSLAVAPYLQGEHCLDVGSGGGLPGIPLAIIQPQRHFTLLDTNGKKTRFMQQVAIELALNNITVVQARVETWKSAPLFDTIMSRAFASIVKFVNTSSLHLSEKGQLLAMKGQYPEDELSLLPPEFIIKYVKTLEIPLLIGGRCIISVIKKI